MRRLLLTLALILSAAPAFAQGPPTGWILKIYQPGGTVVVSTTLIPLAAGGFVCNQPQATGVTVNPNKVIVNDPTNAADVACVYTDPWTGPLLSLAVGNYEAGLAATNSGGTSGETAHVLFTRTAPVSPPAVPTGLRVVR